MTSRRAGAPRRGARTVAAVLGALVLAACGAGPTGAPAATATTASPAASAARPAPPPAGGVLDYQLGGAYPPAADVDVVVRDRTAAPVRGGYSVCYVNAFQTQPGETAWWRRAHPDLLLRDARGRLVEDEDWPGEVLLDTSTSARRTAAARVVGRWVDGCAAAGYRAVELDNLDAFTRSGGRLTQGQAVAFAGLLARRAHAAGLAVAQKNTAELTRRQVRAVGFDFAVAEECQVWDECDVYTGHYGRHVLEVEYTDTGRRPFREACAARGDRVSVLLRDRDVVPRGTPGYVSEHC
ncbi:endo alpha-1,4 polygalactosaminidase [uncultured Pseudokineococcus sp.]|uniref:endo alpha-1,4 polygalactosaminidase n=1 Tax=uncultured Pseudokineococcus sp. TaxID=1642928 RepID=UPI00262E7FFB|nr:endo alpha-1,4 polygalactosaminidase [uncultured Pseudokineococcus sp.]